MASATQFAPVRRATTGLSLPRGPIHPYSARCITVREAARLHSYPDWFSVPRTKWHGFRQDRKLRATALARCGRIEGMAAFSDTEQSRVVTRFRPKTELLLDGHDDGGRDDTGFRRDVIAPRTRPCALVGKKRCGMDHVRQVRSKIMAAVHSRGNTTTEAPLGKLLWAAGIRGYRKHWPALGKPDFAWPGRKLPIFVDGCFWHGCSCKYLPRTNTNSAKQNRSKQASRPSRRAIPGGARDGPFEDQGMRGAKTGYAWRGSFAPSGSSAIRAHARMYNWHSVLGAFFENRRPLAFGPRGRPEVNTWLPTEQMQKAIANPTKDSSSR